MYSYFICIGRQQKRTNCTKSAVLIETVESKIETEYRKHELGSELLASTQEMILHQLEIHQREARTEEVASTRQRQQLQAEQKKLLDAHYADAIPINLLKSEQMRIGRTLEALEIRRQTTTVKMATIEKNLAKAIDFAANLTASYRAANDKLKREINQALFQRIYIHEDDTTTSELREPFRVLLSGHTSTAAVHHSAALKTEPDALDRELEALYEDWKLERSHAISKTPLVCTKGFEY